MIEKENKVRESEKNNPNHLNTDNYILYPTIKDGNCFLDLLVFI